MSSTKSYMTFLCDFSIMEEQILAALLVAPSLPLAMIMMLLLMNMVSAILIILNLKIINNKLSHFVFA